ncbi:MAG: hypothetical protein ABIH76_08560 [Candidatus Bathyarchaeota archaeon]
MTKVSRIIRNWLTGLLEKVTPPSYTILEVGVGWNPPTTPLRNFRVGCDVYLPELVESPNIEKVPLNARFPLFVPQDDDYIAKLPFPNPYQRHLIGMHKKYFQNKSYITKRFKGYGHLYEHKMVFAIKFSSMSNLARLKLTLMLRLATLILLYYSAGKRFKAVERFKLLFLCFARM